MTLSNFKGKSTELSRISSKLSKETLDKMKFNKKSYAQTSKSNMENIIYIKDVFPKLLTKKINNIINNKMSQAKSKINIIIKVLQLRNLSVGLGEEPCIGFTQENLMENSLQDLSLLIYFSPWSML